MKLILLIALIPLIAFAKPKREVIFEFGSPNTKTMDDAKFQSEPAPVAQLAPEPTKQIQQKRTAPAPIKGNLPSQYHSRNPARLQKTSLALVSPASIKALLKGLNIGDMILAEIPHWIIAFPDEKAPVVARVTDARFNGATFVGESWLEPNTRRIFIDFKFLRIGSKTYSINGRGLTARGIPGFEGVYHSNEGSYFAGNFLSSFVAGYFESQVPQYSTPYGQVMQDNSLDSAWKKGMASGAMQTADIFRAKLEKVPEFSELRGPTFVQVLITEEGKQK
jgi:hypothetical protein